MYIHLTTHSAFSLQEGLLQPEELVHAAQSYGISVLRLTNHNLLKGAVEFVTACKRAGIQPILGLEVDLEHDPLRLLAMNENSWSNLCRLSSAIALRDEPEAVCTREILNAYSNECNCTSGHIFHERQKMETRFREYPEALAATVEIAERCRFDFPVGKAHIPTVPLPTGISAAEFLGTATIDIFKAASN